MTHEPTWHDAARTGFRRVLALYDMDDSRIVYRRTQEEAFRNLEARLHIDTADLSPLTPLETELLRLEIYYLANFEKRDFKTRYGDGWTMAGRCSWIAGQAGFATAFEVNCILEEVSAVLDAACFDAHVEAIVRECTSVNTAQMLTT